jgi:hypothetical protein
MKRFPKFASMFLALAVAGLVAADSASAAGLRGRNNCDSCAEPACGAAEPACAAAEPACCAAEPACAAAPACCSEPRHRGRARRGLFSRRAKASASSCSSCCTEPGCAATAGCGAEPGCAAAEPACGACAGG